MAEGKKSSILSFHIHHEAAWRLPKNPPWPIFDYTACNQDNELHLTTILNKCENRFLSRGLKKIQIKVCALFADNQVFSK